MVRTALCHCGALRIECDGDPKFIAQCHCGLCQRRTGSSYSLGAWFDRSDVRIEGDEKTYRRTGEDTEFEIIFHFCPTCGTNLYWEQPGSVLPHMLSVAGGTFADRELPMPSFSVHAAHRHAWLDRLDGAPSHVGAHGSETE